MMRLTKLFSSFSIINKLTNKQRLISGSRFPRARSESIPHTHEPQLPVALSPFQQYLINRKALERPFTGKFWHEMSAGFYHCVVCDTRLFTYNHKFQANTGYTTFWKAIGRTITTKNEMVKFDEVNAPRAKNKLEPSAYKRCMCSKCKTHLGAVFNDGPPPSFLRYTINSCMLKFYEFPDFPNPHIARKQIKKEYSRKNRIRYIR